MKNRGFLQISFQWLFAIVVGIVILFLTIYGVTRLIGLGERTQETKTSKELGILLNPLETGFEEAKSSFIEFQVNTRVYTSCDDFGDFGKQGISISQESFNKWPEPSEEVVFYNKYIFSEYPIEARKMSVFSKPFDFPYKVANLIYMTSADKTYCFSDAPEDIQDEIEALKIENILIENCTGESVSVCFESGIGCDVDVDYLNREVNKGDDKVYFEGDALMYAAIFSEAPIYECQLKRLMKRVANLAELYKDKADFIAVSGCSTNLNSDLQLLISMTRGLKGSYELVSIKDSIDEIDRKNKNNARCRLW